MELFVPLDEPSEHAQKVISISPIDVRRGLVQFYEKYITYSLTGNVHQLHLSFHLLLPSGKENHLFGVIFGDFCVLHSKETMHEDKTPSLCVFIFCLCPRSPIADHAGYIGKGVVNTNYFTVQFAPQFHFPFFFSLILMQMILKLYYEELKHT